MNKKQKSLNNKGFSLVELIVVIAIMAVLVGVLAPQFIKYVESSRQSTDLQNIQQLKTAVEVECTEQEITTAVTIETTTTKAEVKGITLTTTSNEVDFKSSGWKTGGKYTYTPTSGSWTITTSVGTNTNSGPAPKDLDTVFK